MDSDKEARIRERAYEIWVREGRPHGRDAEHWQAAAAEIAAESNAMTDASAAGSKPRSEAASPAAVVPPSDTPPLRSRRAASKPAGAGATEPSTGGGASRRGRKTPGT